ncbi:MAG: DNA polymerase III subunit delta [Moraxellaceae bacterium]|nr:DNA polymerase III subunit delta [Moraxellaceae bacterium]
MKYDYWGLLKHLKNPLRTIYVLHGDEALLQQEALIALRKTAIKQGFTERERHDIDKGHDWAAAFADSNALSLFSDKKLIEIHGNKPDAAGAKVLEAYLKNAPEDNLIILVLPKLEAAAQKSKWFVACEDNGITVSCAPLSDFQFKEWITTRCAEQQLSLNSDALTALCQQTEGNLLAAHQEVTKLALLYGKSSVNLEQLQSAISESARFSLFDLSATALAGDATKTAKILFSLKAEGQAESLVLWVLSKEIKTLSLLFEGTQQGLPLSQLFQQQNVWSKQQAVVQKALKRLNTKRMLVLNDELLAADKAIKGQNNENAWDILLRLSLSLAGVTLFENAV